MHGKCSPNSLEITNSKKIDRKGKQEIEKEGEREMKQTMMG